MLSPWVPLGIRKQVKPAKPEPPVRAPDEGDRFMLGYDFSNRSSTEVSREFGQQFADVLVDLEPGWRGPVLSGYGLHLVRVLAREPARDPALDEVREQVRLELEAARRDERLDAFHRDLRARYVVRSEE